MDSVLIVSNASSTMGIISSLLQAQAFGRIVTTQDGNEARRYLVDGDVDLVIVDTPLLNEFGDDFALHAAEATGAGVILVVELERLDDVSMRTEDSGVFAVPKPIAPDFFYHAVKLLMASRERLRELEAENRRLQKKLDETRTVGRAKCLLVQHLHLTEQQAHRHIEKLAMDTRESRVEVAESVLRRYAE